MSALKTDVIVVIAFLVLISTAFADDATQTDWSGGDGITGPVTDWGNTFDISTKIDSSGTKGEISLGRIALDVPLKYTVDNEFTGSSFAYACDLDGDNDNDILGASREYSGNEVAWWENIDGNGTFGPKRVIESPFNGAHTVYASDLDGDGDLDVLGDSYAGDEIAWWENTDGAGNFGLKQSISTSFDGAHCVYSADIDGDDDMDVLGAAHLGDEIAWWRNLGGGSFSSKLTIANSFDGARSVHTADLDNDNDLDVLGVAADGNEIAWWENTDGNGTFGPKQVIDSTVVVPTYVYAGDINGDGYKDVAGAVYIDAEIVWWENDGSGGFGPKQIIATSFQETSSVSIADVDADNDLDVLGGARGSTDEVVWWENADGYGTSWTEHIVNTIPFDASSVCAVDINGNGGLDLVSAAYDRSEIAWWEICEFSPTGNLASSILDTGATQVEWGPIDWNDNTPTGTSVTVDVRASSDPDYMGYWIEIPGSGDELPWYLDGLRFFQYKISLATDDGDVSPTFEDITIDWNPVGIDGDEGNVPTTFALHPAVPNPSDGSASIGFALPRACEVELSLYDIKGRKIATLASGQYQPGEYSTTASGLSSGVYIYEMIADEFSDSKKMVVR